MKKLPLKNLSAYQQWQDYQQQPHIRESVKELEQTQRITWRIIIALHALFFIVLLCPQIWLVEIDSINPVYIIMIAFIILVWALYKLTLFHARFVKRKRNHKTIKQNNHN